VIRALSRSETRTDKALDVAARLEDLTIPAGNRIEALKGDQAGRRSMRIDDQYRVRFRTCVHDGAARSSECQDQSNTRTPVIELRVAQREPQDGRFMKRVNVLEVAADPDVSAQ
jgi:toxin HigB-1